MATHLDISNPAIGRLPAYTYFYLVNPASENTDGLNPFPGKGSDLDLWPLSFLESSGIMVLRTDLSGNITYLSPAYASMDGRDSAHFPGQSVFEIFRFEEEEAVIAFTQLRQGSKEERIRTLFGHSNPSGPFIIEFTLRPIFNEYGEWSGAEGIGFPQSWNSEGSLRHQHLESRLEEAEKIKDRFLSNISHEIRTPLNGIMGMAQLLQKTNLDSNQKEFLNIISKSGENLLQTLNQLIDLSLDLGGKLNIQEDEIDVGRMFGLMSGLFSEQAILKNLDLDFQLAGNFPMLTSDEFRIQQILKQFISNAISFSDSGNILVSARLETNSTATHLILEVSDSGKGIEFSRQQYIESILSPEGSADASFFKARGGLGLLTVRMISDALHAEPGFVSAPGKGSTFWVKIPVTIKTDVKKPLQVSLADTISVLRQLSPKVLLTDDNAVNLKVASEILSRAGCRVVLATNGKEALEKASKEFFHLIFMDIQMPVMDGLEASRHIQELRLPNPPAIVAMTAFVMTEDKKRFLEAGMHDFIPKPISGDQLLAKVRHWTEKSIQKNPDSEAGYLQAEPPEISLNEIFDFEVLRNLSRHVGDEILLSSLEEFASELRATMDVVANSLQERNIRELLSCFHTLKGNAGTFGLNRMADLARNLEVELKNGDFSGALAGVSLLEESTNEFLNTYKQLYSSYEWKN